MTVPVHTISATWPRVLTKPADKTALQARTNDTAGWKTRWDAQYTSAANTYKAQSSATLATASSNPQLRLVVLAFYGYLEETGRPANGYKDAAIKAAVYLAGLSDSSPPTGRRERCLALAWVLDLCYNDMTTTERDTIAAELVNTGGQCDRMLADPADGMDGWSGNDQAAAFHAALACANHPGYDTKARAWIQIALEFWYGTGPGQGRIELMRYQYADGAIDKTPWYCYQAFWGELYLLWAFTMGTTFDAFADVPDLTKCWEWLLWSGLRGAPDSDYEAGGDMGRTTNKVHYLQRQSYSILTGKSSPPARGYFRWLWDRWDEQETPYADTGILDVLFFDPAVATATSPSSSPPAKVRKFTPPGLGYFRGGALSSDAWNYDTSAVIRISGRARYRIGHEHLDAGSVQIRLGPEVLLQSPSGYYDDYSTPHHYNWYQRTIGQSLAPVLLDPGQVFQRYSATVADDGGQHFKKFIRSGSTVSDPETVSNMLNEGGGLAWLRTDRFALAKTVAGVAHHWVVEPRSAYRKFHTDPHRWETLKLEYLVIEPSAGNGLPGPALLYYCRGRKANPSSRMVVPLHFWGDPTTTSYGWHVMGYRGASSLTGGGKLWVDWFDKANLTITKVSQGTLDANGYGANQFRILGAGTNWAPGEALSNDRHKPDLGNYSMLVERAVPTTEEHLVGLLMPTVAAASEPVAGRTWLTETDYYGITLGSETFRLHKTQELAILPGGSPDTTPPASVTGAAAAARDRALRLTYTDPVDTDYSYANVEIRTV